jgi:hypothetical protein
LLLSGDGTNNSNNNVFLDSSSNALSVTREGNVSQGTFSPFSQTGWSNFFDGDSDRLSITNNAAFQFGTGDYTVEAWVYISVATSFGIIVKCSADGSWASGWTLALNSGGTGWTSYHTGINTTTGFATNRWIHLAITRSGSTETLWVNGANAASAAAVTLSPTSTLTIGADITATNYEFNGHISNVRVVKGTALYTSAFTPSTTPLTAVSGTSLLTCQSNRFIDNSTNNFSITRNGNCSVQAFSPFPETPEYSSSIVGGSAYFDGSGDRLISATNTALDLTGDFTIEFWINFASLAAAYQVLFDTSQNGTAGASMTEIFVDSSGVLTYYARGSTILTSPTAAVGIGAWTHVAVVKSGTSQVMYVNGVSVASATSSTQPNTGFSWYIGDRVSGAGSANYPLNGYIAGFRVVKGTAVYTAAFTPPTAPLTAITNTSLLLNFTNAGIIDSAAQNTIETVGDARISTAQSKFGNSSIFFDGTGDYIRANVNSVNFGTGDFTIEYWTYFTASGQAEIMIDTSPSSYGGVLAIRADYIDSSRFVYVDVGGISFTATYTAGTVLTNNWRHWALVRYGTGSNNVKLYLDGVAIGQGTTTASVSVASANPLNIGGAVGPTSGYSNVTGYMDDIRITKGLARYIANFTPPTSAFDKKGGTILPAPSSIEVLVVSGGGGGYGLGGGGGAGGMKANTSFSVSSNTNYSVTVGAGGTGSAGAYYSSVTQGTRGGNSSFSSITTTGGGPGSGFPLPDGNSAGGGSGGGGAYYGNAGLGISGEGNNGGAGLYNDGYGVGGGGGGRGAVGNAGTLSGTTGVGGDGGIGLANTITGASVTYAGGGGGSADGRITTVMGKGATGVGGNAAVGNGTTAGSGVANLGGGGGGNYFGGDLTAGNAGNGGSGVVVIAYPSSNANLFSIAAGLTYTYDETSRPGYKVYKFTAGTGNISW